MPPKRAGGPIDRSKDVKITAQLVHASMKKARFMPPYFGHESLSASLYTGGKFFSFSLTFADNGVLSFGATDRRLELVRPVVEPPCKNTLTDIESLESDEELDTDEENENNLDFGTKTTNAQYSSLLAKAPPLEERVVGGCQPVGGRGKKLCAVEDMDDDDKLLYHLKLAKWTEREIHTKFVSEGRINYSQKTIGTRFCRMRRFIVDDTDERLKNGKAVWFESEQSLLPNAFTFATEKIQKERRALEKRKWDLVAEYIQKHEPTAMFSGDACRQQYEALIRGKAPVPPEKQRRLSPQTAGLLAARRKQVAYIKQLEKADRPKV